jgi:OHCU decarboxylase
MTTDAKAAAAQPGGETPLMLKPSDLAHPAFLKIYGGIYERSPWVAEAAFARRGEGLDTVERLHAVMKATVEAAGPEKQLVLIRAHPDLATTPAQVKMTQHSVAEQRGAGLNTCTPAEAGEFATLNAEYRSKFGFPFIIAVKGLNKFDILAEFRRRMNNTPDQERATALEQIHKIARLRLEALS